MTLKQAGPALKSEIHWSALSLFQRILLSADGTLTKMLETYTQETIHVVKLAESRQAFPQAVEPLHLLPGDTVIERKILLQGRQSGRNWLYAESLLLPDRLPPKFQEQLLTTQEPIGKLWISHKVETFKEIITTYRQPAGQIAGYFNLKPSDPFLCRTYRVFSNKMPVMMITEKFPASFYVESERPSPVTNGRQHVNGLI